MTTLDRALVRPPAANFAAGLTQANLGGPDLGTALSQHAAYCDALVRAGLELVRLPPDPLHPDSTFVEDTAILTPRGVVLTRPGAASRAGETAAIAGAFDSLGLDFLRIETPGHVDGGDVCEVGDRFFIGLSSRTDEQGARQLAEHLDHLGYRSTTIDVRSMGPAMLHLKSGLSDLGEGRVAVAPELAGHAKLAGLERLVVDASEVYAANCVRVNDRVLIATGFPRFADSLDRLGLRVEALEMSEFQKMDGGLSCLSLRFPAALGSRRPSA